MLTLQESQAEGPVYEIKTKLENLTGQLNETDARTDEEILNKNTYLHMLDRMKKDFIATKIKTGEMEESLRNKNQILELETEKQRKTNEAKK
mmetsp:Transcript_8871/g.8266  ORF Transcript_8871/g.8266 Transcript_8871/m.8266 type:complete len:92 (+) Transcript_8871:310-585(+)